MGKDSCYGAEHDDLLRKLALGANHASQIGEQESGGPRGASDDAVGAKHLQHQVRFLLKNPDLLLRNPDFLLRNPDFLLKDDDFIIKQHQHEEATTLTTAPQVCPPCESCPPCPASTRQAPPRVCNSTAHPGSWGLITCNDQVDMSAVKVKGVGEDASWCVSSINRK